MNLNKYFRLKYYGTRTLYKNKEISQLENKEIRQPKINTKAEKLCENEKLMLARLGTMRIWSLKRKIMEMKYKKTKKRISADKKQLRLEI